MSDADDARAAARKAFLAVNACSSTTESWAQLLRLGADQTRENGFRHIANRLSGAAERHGRPEIDDTAALKRISELEAQGLIKEAIGMVARRIAGDDEAARHTIETRLRRKRNAQK